MKYGIIKRCTDFASCSIADIVICENVYTLLKQESRIELRLIQLEDSAPEGSFRVKMMDGSIQLLDGSCYGYTSIDLTQHLIQFDPDANFEQFGTGFAKELSDPLKKENYEGSNKAFLLLSEKEGPSNWMAAITDYNTLDFGEIIQVTPIL